MSKSGPIYLQIKEYLMQLIDLNYDIKNYKLPSENQLAIKFNSSRLPAIKALKILEDEGIVFRQQGKGTFINTNKPLINPKSNTIYLIIPYTAGLLMSNIIEGINSFCQQKNIILSILLSHDDSVLEAKLIKYAFDSKSLGILLYPVDNDIYSNEILNLVIENFPVVLIDRKLHGLNLSYVACNHYNQGYNATKCLIGKGHTNIGFISMPLSFASSVSDRNAGYEDAILEHFGKLNYVRRLEISYADVQIAENAINEFLNENNFTAIITNNGIAGNLVYKNLISRKLSIPSDVSVMLFDNEFKGIEYLMYGKPFYVDQNPYEIGKNAMELLWNLIYNEAKPTSLMIDETIVDY